MVRPEQRYTATAQEKPRKTGKATVGIYGAGSMGGGMSGLFAQRGDHITVFDTSKETVQGILKTFERDDRLDPSTVEGHDNPRDFCSSFSPNARRVIMLSLPHGKVEDIVLEGLLPLLDADDLILDGANASWQSTEKHQAMCARLGILYLGTGVSGGYQAARNGPSISPSGSREAYTVAEPFLKKWAAKDPNGEPCVRYLGPGGCGHFVKTVHNGIEQGMLGVYCEAYALLRHSIGLTNTEIADVFDEWNKYGELRDNYLIQLSALTSRFTEGDGVKDAKGIVDDVDDKVVQDSDDSEATGRWTAEELAGRHIAGNTIASAHFTRLISAEESQRVIVAKQLDIPKPSKAGDVDRKTFIEDLRLAVYAGTLASFIQGLNLLYRGSAEESWHSNIRDCLFIWRGGCIIQSLAITDLFDRAYKREPSLPTPAMDSEVAKELRKTYDSLKRVVRLSIDVDAVVPAISTSLEYIKTIGGRDLPTKHQELVMDAFGHHQYDLISEKQHEPKKGIHHTEFKPA